MSIHVLDRIWKSCQFKDGTLLLLLAFADQGHEEDGSSLFPGLDLLAAMCRCTVRSIQDRIREARASGVLKLVGPDGEDQPDDARPQAYSGRKAEFRIDLDRLDELQALHEVQSPDCEFCSARKKRAKKAAQRRAKRGAGKGEPGNAKGENSRAHIEDNRNNRIEPSAPERARSPEGRALRLAEAIGQEKFQAWFGTADFIDGNPPKIVMDAPFKRNWVLQHFMTPLRTIFGEALSVEISERQQAPAAAPEAALPCRNVETSHLWWSDRA